MCGKASNRSCENHIQNVNRLVLSQNINTNESGGINIITIMLGHTLHTIYGQLKQCEIELCAGL